MKLEQLETIMAALGGVRSLRGRVCGAMSPSEVSGVEAIVGPIPSLYRSFLLKYGLAWAINPLEASMLQPHRDFSTAAIGVFFAKEKDFDLLEHFDAYQGRVPAHFLPIIESDNDLLCLDLGKANYGKIYYWDRLNETDPEGYADYFGMPMPRHFYYQNVYLVADSFGKLWQQMSVRAE